MWWHSEEGRTYVAELLVRCNREEQRWTIPAYIRSWWAMQAAWTRHHGPRPKTGMDPLWEEVQSAERTPDDH